MITQLADISLDEKTLVIEIRPRDAEPRIELDIFVALDNPGVVPLDKSAKEFLAQQDFSFSPFDHGSFEPILRTAVGNLDSHGIYWPEKTLDTDRLVPKAQENLIITDTWAIFARPRSTNFFMEDLDRFQKLLETDENITEVTSSAISSIITDPSIINEDIILPAFR